MSSPGKPSVVYRVYDEHNCLLYVGCTSDMRNRFKQHERESEWLRFATHTEVVGPFPRRQALDIEDEAMRTEAPFFNCLPTEVPAILANATRARDLVYERGIPRYVRCPLLRWSCGLAADRYYVTHEATKAAIRDEFPYVSREDRMAAYLATHPQSAAPALASDSGHPHPRSVEASPRAGAA